jgi:hypothetical protein
MGELVVRVIVGFVFMSLVVGALSLMGFLIIPKDSRPPIIPQSIIATALIGGLATIMLWTLVMGFYYAGKYVLVWVFQK